MTFTFFINLFTNMIMNDPKKTWKKIYLQRNSVKQIFKIQSPKRSWGLYFGRFNLLEHLSSQSAI